MSKVERKRIETLSTDEILAAQVREILRQSGISNLYSKEDGSLTGTYTEKLWPASTQIKNLRIEIDKKGNSIVINGTRGERSENTGSII